MQIYKHNSMLIIAIILIHLTFLIACRKHEPKVDESILKIINPDAGVFSPGSSLHIVLDGFGYVNGELDMTKTHIFNKTIVHYTGTWSLTDSIQAKYEALQIAISTTPGDRVDLIATMTAVTFNFIGKNWFPDAGSVDFFIDDAKIGEVTFDENTPDTYVILAPEIGEHKISAVITSGGVCISGYVVTVPIIKKGFMPTEPATDDS